MTKEKPHILVVDNEEEIQDLLEENLMEQGYVCHPAGSSPRALETLAEKRVDLALIDLIVPEMTGLTLCKQLIQRYPGVPVVFLTAVDDLSFSGQRVQTVAEDYLVKPISRKFLQRIIDEVLEKRRVRQHDQALPA